MILYKSIRSYTERNEYFCILIKLPFHFRPITICSNYSLIPRLRFFFLRNISAIS